MLHPPAGSHEEVVDRHGQRHLRDGLSADRQRVERSRVERSPGPAVAAVIDDKIAQRLSGGFREDRSRTTILVTRSAVGVEVSRKARHIIVVDSDTPATAAATVVGAARASICRDHPAPFKAVCSDPDTAARPAAGAKVVSVVGSRVPISRQLPVYREHPVYDQPHHTPAGTPIKAPVQGITASAAVGRRFTEQAVRTPAGRVVLCGRTALARMTAAGCKVLIVAPLAGTRRGTISSAGGVDRGIVRNRQVPGNAEVYRRRDRGIGADDRVAVDGHHDRLACATFDLPARIQFQLARIHNQGQDRPRAGTGNGERPHRQGSQRRHIGHPLAEDGDRIVLLHPGHGRPGAAVVGVVDQQTRQEVVGVLGINRAGPAVCPAASSLGLQSTGKARHVVVIQRNPAAAAATGIARAAVAAVRGKESDAAYRAGSNVNAPARPAAAGFVTVNRPTGAVGGYRTVHRQLSRDIKANYATARTTGLVAAGRPTAAAAVVGRLGDRSVVRPAGRTGVTTATLASVSASTGIINLVGAGTRSSLAAKPPGVGADRSRIGYRQVPGNAQVHRRRDRRAGADYKIAADRHNDRFRGLVRQTTARIQNERPGVHRRRQIDEARVANFKVRYRQRRQQGHVRIGAVGDRDRTELLRPGYRSPDTAVTGVVHQQVRQKVARGLGVNRTGPAVGPAASSLGLKRTGKARHVVVVQRDPAAAAATCIARAAAAAVRGKEPGAAYRGGSNVNAPARPAAAGFVTVNRPIGAIGGYRTVHRQLAGDVQTQNTAARTTGLVAAGRPTTTAAVVSRRGD